MIDTSRFNARFLMLAHAGVVMGVLVTLMRDGGSAGLLSAGFLVAGVVGSLGVARIAKFAYRHARLSNRQDVAGFSDPSFQPLDRWISTL